MKKGYHDYTPIIKKEKKEKKVVKSTHEPKYVTSTGGSTHMISDERGMIVAGTDVLQFGWRMPSMHAIRPVKTPYTMSTKDYIKYNGKL